MEPGLEHVPVGHDQAGRRAEDATQTDQAHAFGKLAADVALERIQLGDAVQRRVELPVTAAGQAVALAAAALNLFRPSIVLVTLVLGAYLCYAGFGGKTRRLA